MKFRFLLCLLLALLFCGCNQPQWYTGGDGVLFYSSKKFNDPQNYRWFGRTFGGLAVGEGYLVHYDNSGNRELDRKMYNAVWGSLDKVKDPNSVNLGPIKAMKHTGFHVVVTGNKVFIGEYRNNAPHGRLKYYEDGQLAYDGMWQNGKRHGQGMVLSGRDTIYGTWNQDELEGEVFVSWGSGFYKGNMKGGKPHGHGYMVSDGLSYAGNWEFGYRNGYGEAVLPNGDEYSGNWDHDLFSGKGEYRSPDFVYEGEWDGGMMSGQGTLAYSNGDVYEGGFRWNTFLGKGAYRFNDGTFYEGNFALGLFNGEGSLFLTNGNVFVGEFSYNGFGRYGTMYFIEDGDTSTVDYEDMSREPPVSIGDLEREIAKLKIDFGYDRTQPLYLVPDDTGHVCQVREDKAREFRERRNTVHEFVDGASTAAFFLTLPFPQLAPVVMPVVAVANVADMGHIAYTAAQEKENGGEIDWLHTILQLISAGFNAVFPFLSFNDELPADPRFSAYHFVEAGVGSAVVKGVESALTRGATRNVEKAAEKSAVKGAEMSAEKSAEKAAEKAAVRGVGGAVSKNAERAAANTAEKYSAQMAAERGAAEKYIQQASERATVRSVEGTAGKFGRFRLASDAKLAPSVRPVKTFAPQRLKVAQGLETKGASMSSKLLPSARSFAGSKGAAGVGNATARALPQGMVEVNQELKRIQGLGPLKMSKTDIDKLLANPVDYLRTYMRAYVGTPQLNKGFQEFFIRLSMTDKNAARQLLENPVLREKLKSAVRGAGGNHEWLMAKNVSEFLTNPVYGKDGPKMFLMLNRFVQDTKSVVFKAGGSHYTGGANSSVFHAKLSDIIASEKSGDVFRLAGKIRMHAKEFLTPESYNDFMKVYRQFFF